jgi:hypothetical protein
MRTVLLGRWPRLEERDSDKCHTSDGSPHQSRRFDKKQEPDQSGSIEQAREKIDEEKPIAQHQKCKCASSLVSQSAFASFESCLLYSANIGFLLALERKKVTEIEWRERGKQRATLSLSSLNVPDILAKSTLEVMK